MFTAEEKASSEGLGKASRKKKSRVTIIAVITAVIMIIGATTWLIARSTPNPFEPPPGYIEHTTIWIGGNSYFTSDNGVVGGDGTAADPYIIAGWCIRTSILWDGAVAGIQIANVNAHFIVRDCYISTSSSNRDWGIYLTDCVNGTLEGNNCSGNQYGMRLDFSSNIMIRNNSCFSNYCGIELSRGSTDNTVINNTCSDCWYGISLESSRNTLMNNTCISNNLHGIYVRYSSDENTLRNNTCSWNRGTGMDFHVSSSDTVSDNVCSSNGWYGISFDLWCNNSYVSGNVCNLNGEDGIRLRSSSNNTLTDNYLDSNNHSGISLSKILLEFSCIGNEMTWSDSDSVTGKSPSLYRGSR